MDRRALLTFAPAALLAGCGFRLRGAPEFAFDSLFLNAPAGSPLARELQRTLEASGGRLKVLREPATLPSAQAVFDLLAEQQERAVVGLTTSGQVRELQLRLRVRIRLRGADGSEWIPDTELLQQREGLGVQRAGFQHEHADRQAVGVDQVGDDHVFGA